MQRIAILALVILAVACENKKADKGWDVTLTGKVNKPQSGVIEIQEIIADGSGTIDTLTLKPDSTFSHTLHITEPGYYQINFYRQQFVRLIVNKTNLEIVADGDTQAGFYDVKGSPEMDVIHQVQQMLAELQNSPEVAALESEYQKAIQEGNQQLIGELQEKYALTQTKVHDQVVELLKKQPASLGVVNLLQSNVITDRDKYIDLYIDAADKVKKEWPESKHAKEFIEMVDKLKVTAIGQEAPEIALPNPEGQIVKLSSLRGKYVLVDFWAKWCGPCRAENPYVVKAYHAFKDKGFEVYGVSLDRTKEDWVQAIKDDGLVWTQVSDLKYYESQAAHDYGVNAIPFSLLLDPQGKIIAKDLRRDKLEKKLAEIFNNKKG